MANAYQYDQLSFHYSSMLRTLYPNFMNRSVGSTRASSGLLLAPRDVRHIPCGNRCPLHYTIFIR